MIRSEEDRLLKCKSQMEEVAGSVGFGLVSLHRKVMLLSGSLGSLRTDYPGRGSLIPVSKAPDTKASRIQKVRKDY